MIIGLLIKKCFVNYNRYIKKRVAHTHQDSFWWISLYALQHRCHQKTIIANILYTNIKLNVYNIEITKIHNKRQFN